MSRVKRLKIIHNDQKLREKFAKNAKNIAMNFSLDKMITQMQDVYFKLIK